MLKRTLVAAAITFAAVSAQAQQVLISQGFNSVAGLVGKGWSLTNASTPIGSVNNWFQGDSTQFAAQAGASDSYIAGNFNLAAAGGTIDALLVTPTFSTERSGNVSFRARAVIDSDPTFFDQLRFGLIPSAAAPLIAAPDQETLGGPSTTIPGVWTLYTVGFAAQGVGSTARFAIEYTGAADTSNYVGIDTLTVSAVPEPSSW